MKDQMQIIREHAARYIAMRPIDAIKLVWQSEYGAGHLVTDRESALLRLQDELDSCARPSFSPAIEDIGGGYVRVDLRMTDIPPQCLVGMFAMPPERKGDGDSFAKKLNLLRTAADEGVFGFTVSELERVIADFKPIPSHSGKYRELYKPAYRVVDKRFVSLIPIIRDAVSRKGRVNIAIDGRAAAGKTTAANLLSHALGCPVFHADDYFLQPGMRTPERLCEPGGNLDRERMKHEVIDRLGCDIEYTPFDCSVQALGKSVCVPASRINIVEGSYSMHPYFGDAFDIRIFCTVDPTLQRERIRVRNGERMLERFIAEWIPMEEKYFNAFNIASKSDYLLDNGSIE